MQYYWDFWLNNYLDMLKLFDSLVNWYFSKRSLPYWAVFLVDLAICFFSGILVFWFYYRGAVTLGNIIPLTRTVGFYLIFTIIGFRVFHTYSGLIRYSSFVDLIRLAKAQALSCFLSLIAHYIIYPYTYELKIVPLAGRQIIAMTCVATVLMWLFRVIVKNIYDVSFNTGKGLRTLIYGTGNYGIGLAKNIRNVKPSQFNLKGFISHDKSFNKRTLLGEKVFQPGQKLENALFDYNIQAVLVSPVRIDNFRADEGLQNMLISKGIKIFFAEEPKRQGVNQGSNSLLQNVHQVNVSDLLPRDEIKIDMTRIAAMLRGRRILITGSAGSIGSEMVRQVAAYNPAELILIDQAETPQHDIRVMMARDFPDIKTETYVASIANAERMEEIFKEKRPEVVFHAAAYKRVPMMEDNPSEAVQNNIVGTKIIADLSVKYGARKFVMISTDKAVNPSSVMGCSKRICEIYCQSLNQYLHAEKHDDNACEFITTRFGNVLGSNGSVIPLFEKQIASGGPVTVTHPDIIRFFMLIPEACELVLEAGTQGKGGQIFVFDMGKPVKIADLAKRMIQLSGVKGVQIKYTGLRPGEKLYEEVLSDKENSLPSFNDRIRIAKVREYDFNTVAAQIDDLAKTALTFDSNAIVAKMKELVPEYRPLHSPYSAPSDRDPSVEAGTMKPTTKENA